ncbi:hypothetical protein B9Z55_005852 [Caenorhabditis nigoni]|uniref:Uncharacterized protein n=1 Tax=Caenorhabditis nigoni TaxID=1611254 RepID=A0A2G5V333_9PELO|nr:hypothetical protein B9Z55_005852 [Caenorhabditis nigoni]
MNSLDDFEETGSGSSSLLDILIQAEEPSDDTDPLDAIGNIGDDVLGQLSGAIASGEDVMQNALKMFQEAMSYTKSKPPISKQSRKNDLGASFPSLPTLTPIQAELTAKQFHQSDRRAGFSPRTNVDVDCPEFFLNGQKNSAQFKLLHEKLEKERSQQFDDLVSKDVERLLSAASKIYGPREWTKEEKMEFSSYCRNLRSGTLSDDDKKNLENFYCKAYNESLTGSSINQESVKKIKLESKKSEDEIEHTFDLQTTLDAVQMNSHDPRMKYEKEKEFRDAANSIFTEVFEARLNNGSSKAGENGVVGDLRFLTKKLNELMGDENKQWTPTEVSQLRRYLDKFREKMHFTIVQTKELGNFLRKVFGRLEQYEIERENDTALQEKRKYWQEYRKTHVPVRKEREPRSHPVRPYNRSNINTKEETLEARKIRKAAYLRQWRLDQKEKKLYGTMLETLTNFQK